jgi:protoheme IX farnesyltransferase
VNPFLVPFLIALALLQFVLGGLVEAQTTLVCVDWPLCYGTFAPANQWSGVYEITHRLTAGLLVIGSLALGLLQKDKDKEAWWPLFWVLLQALLGWITFSYRLPTIVTLAHLMLVPLFILSLLPHTVGEESRGVRSYQSKDIPWFFFLLLMLQLFLGGLARKAGTGLMSETPEVVALKTFHRTFGTLTLVALLAAWSGMKRERTSGWFKLVPVLTTAQLVVGFFMWRLENKSGLRLLHLGLAGALLTTLAAARLVLIKREGTELIPGWLGDFLLLTKARLGSLVMATVLVGMLLAPFQLTLLASAAVFIGITLQAMGACALNCVIEKDIDALMERTRIRPLPAGRMSVMTANLMGWGLVILGTVLIYVWSNGLTAFLGVFTVVVYLYAYTPLKIRSPWALVVGAIPGATPPLMGWTAVTGEISGVGWYLFLFLFFWQLPHFLAIAVYHQADYQNAKIITFFKDQGARFVKNWVLILSLMLGGLGFFPYEFSGSSAAYHTVTLILGGVFFGIALQGWLMREEGEEFRRWARTYFLATLFYLPLQLGALLML